MTFFVKLLEKGLFSFFLSSWWHVLFQKNLLEATDVPGWVVVGHTKPGGGEASPFCKHGFFGCNNFK